LVAAAISTRLIRSELVRIQGTRAYDWLMRLPLLGYAVFFATLQMAGLARYVNEPDPARPLALYAIGMVMRLSTITFLLLLAAATILRARPTGKARGLEPRVSAFAGAFLVYVIPLYPRRELSAPAEMVSTLLVLFGSAAAVYTLLRLGRSFSLMAEARGLVTSGPYRLVRHPLYLGELTAVLGIVLGSREPLLAGVTWLVCVGLQLARTSYEERNIRAEFPQYDEYAARTRRLIPGVL